MIIHAKLDDIMSQIIEEIDLSELQRERIKMALQNSSTIENPYAVFRQLNKEMMMRIQQCERDIKTWNDVFEKVQSVIANPLGDD